MNDRDFFNKVASKWDEMCHYDENKINYILNMTNVKENSKILDVATGTGVLIKYLIKKNPKKICAIDLSENMINEAKKKYNDKRIKFYVSDACEFNEENKFDYVFIYSAYPHFKNKDKLFQNLKKLMNYGGKIVVCHSQSKEDINKIHSSKEEVKEDVLESGMITKYIMQKYFYVDKCIDNDEMYYVSGIK